MIPFDLPPKPKLWTPPKPAIIRAAPIGDPKLAMPLFGTFAAAAAKGLRGYGLDGEPGNDANCVALLHNDTGSFLDSSASAQSTTVGSGCTLDTTNFKFGAGSANLDGTANGYLRIADAANLRPGTGDFTVELWLRFSSVTSRHIIGKRTSGAGGWEVAFNGSGCVTFDNSSSILKTGGTAVSTNTWTHVAVSRTGTTGRLFINGTQDGSTFSDSSNYNQTVLVQMGVDPHSGGNAAGTGQIDEVRLSNICRYTASFTPPTKQFV